MAVQSQRSRGSASQPLQGGSGAKHVVVGISETTADSLWLPLSCYSWSQGLSQSVRWNKAQLHFALAIAVMWATAASISFLHTWESVTASIIVVSPSGISRLRRCFVRPGTLDLCYFGHYSGDEGLGCKVLRYDFTFRDKLLDVIAQDLIKEDCGHGVEGMSNRIGSAVCARSQKHQIFHSSAEQNLHHENFQLQANLTPVWLWTARRETRQYKASRSRCFCIVYCSENACNNVDQWVERWQGFARYLTLWEPSGSARKIAMKESGMAALRLLISERVWPGLWMTIIRSLSHFKGRAWRAGSLRILHNRISLKKIHFIMAFQTSQGALVQLTCWLACRYTCKPTSLQVYLVRFTPSASCM